MQTLPYKSEPCTLRYLNLSITISLPYAKITTFPIYYTHTPYTVATDAVPASSASLPWIGINMMKAQDSPPSSMNAHSGFFLPHLQDSSITAHAEN